MVGKEMSEEGIVSTTMALTRRKESNVFLPAKRLYCCWMRRGGALDRLAAINYWHLPLAGFGLSLGCG